jgi:hypothetical protein
METLAWLFVGKPLAILAVAGFLAAGQVALHHKAPARHGRALAWAAAAWAAYALWEWLVAAMSPEANIRVDLLFIWPILLGITALCVFKALSRPKSKS